jgi:hypothetical protein
MDKKTWAGIKSASEGKLDSLQELLAGKFPKALGEVFTIQGKGLFPSPKEKKPPQKRFRQAQKSPGPCLKPWWGL